MKLILKDFTCYETKTRYYIIGSNTTKDAYRIAKIDKTSPNEVSFVDDQSTYSLAEMQDLLAMISNGNKSSGGLKKTLDFCGIFGFVQFQDGYYMLLITKKSPVTLIGGHYVYHVDDTAMIPIMDKPKSATETRYCTIFSQVFNSKNFYFSYTYDISNSLQNNLTGCKVNDVFVWNSYLTEGFGLGLWKIPVIHGFVDQSKISVYGHNVLVTLIARRSRHFAGARFLKRGVNGMVISIVDIRLYALGIIPEPTVPFDSDAINIFNAMYHDHGDTIALQYGGSHLVNTMETYRKISAWTSHSRDVIESIRRYYSNSFADAEKQDAMNLFLGNFQVQKESGDLWDLPTDYYLHNEHPRNLPPIKSYINWYTPEYINNVKVPRLLPLSDDNQFNFFAEYYNPSSLTALDTLFSYRMISTPSNASSFTAKPNSASAKSLVIYNLNIGGVKRWLNPSTKTTPKKSDSLSSAKTLSTPSSTPFNTATLVNKLLAPSVTIGEEKEYSRYIKQFRPRHILTQTDADISEADNIKDHPDFDFFTQYIKKPLTSQTEEPKDEQIYQEFVHVAGNTESYIGIGARSNDISRFEGYHYWFETGVYAQRNKRTTKF
ncbi:phosphatidylinositol-3,5-bisphosphate 5-phosphatase [Terramyces sp. JEL0728]|nr:phosphatidylinositol-3,5-bisphosphate 5-phosphatase [Terramyces sp. JEL0728]